MWQIRWDRTESQELPGWLVPAEPNLALNTGSTGSAQRLETWEKDRIANAFGTR